MISGMNLPVTKTSERNSNIGPSTMTHRRCNVIVLTVDALRADRTALHGYARPTTPTLGRLAKNAIVCERAYSKGTFTQSSCVQLLTSSRPLSYGGYDYGAENRPSTLFQHFHNAGYETTCLSTLHWVNRFFGYANGIDNEIQIFSLSTLPGVAMAMIRNSLKQFEAGVISENDLLSEVDPVLRPFFDNTLEYCNLYNGRHSELCRDFPDSALVNGRYNFTRIKASILRHQAEYLDDNISYIRRHLIPAPDGEEWMNQWLPHEWRHYRTPWKLITEASFRTANAFLAKINAVWARNRLNRFKVYPDARSLADKVISLLENRNHDKPFLIWTHFMDTHLPYVSGPGRKWYKHTPRYLKALGYSNDINPSTPFDGKPKRKEDGATFSALYDAAVLSTDEEIGRIVDAVDRLNLKDDTLIVIAGDHGEELGEHGDYGHYFLLYGHSTRVPMLFHHPDIEGTRLNDLVTINDMAPTIADLAGIGSSPNWEGQSVVDNDVQNRDAVLLETFFGGNCLFQHRPLYFAVRTKNYLYCWKEYRDPSDTFSPNEPELYNTDTDPSELSNLYRPDHPLLPKFNAMIAERMAEIPEISNQRIIDCFGSVGAAAVESIRGHRKARES